MNHSLYSATNPLEHARLERAKRGYPLIDLSDANPTAHGLSIDWRGLAENFCSYLQTRHYQPDSRGLLSARAAVARYYAERSPSMPISPENIFLVASTSEAYHLLLTLLCQPGDSVLEPQVCYPLFEYLRESHSVKHESYTFTPQLAAQDPLLSVSRSALNRAQALFVISPHNPTGSTLKSFSPEVAESRIPLIVDEVFSEFYPDIQSAPPAGTIYPENPVFHLNGISKMCGLPDFKLAWIALNDCAASAWGDKLEFLNDLYLNASYPVQSLLPRILSNRQQYRDLVMTRIRTNLAAFEKMVSGTSRMTHLPYHGGMMLFPHIETIQEQDSFLLALLDRGVSVHPGYYYNWEGDFRVAISLLLEPGRFIEGIHTLSDYLKETA